MATDSVKGSGKQVILPANAGDVPNIISVEKKTSAKGPFTNVLTGWTIRKSTNFHVLVLTGKRNYREIKVTYEKVQSRAQIENAIGKGTADLGFAAAGEMEAAATDIVNSTEFQKLMNDGCILKGFESKGGITSIQDMSKVQDTLQKRVQVGKNSSDFLGGIFNQTSSQLTAINKITGSGTSSALKLKRITTHCSPKSVMNLANREGTSLTEDKKISFIKSIALSETTVATSLKQENDPVKKTNETAENTYKDILKNKLNDAAALQNPLSKLGGIGRSLANLAAQNIGKLKGTVPNKLGSVIGKDSILKSTNLSPDLPGLEKVKNLIDANGNTNLSANINKRVSVAPSVKVTNIINATSESQKFKGGATPENYQFLKVVPSELRKEFKASNRMKSNDETSIKHLIVGFTGGLVGPPELVNAKEIHKRSLEWQRKEMSQTTDRDESTVNSITRGVKFGIQPHYVILRNGDLQRGRPIDAVMNSASTQYDLDGLSLVFVANDTEEFKVNQEQFKTFDIFIREFLLRKPGIDISPAYLVDKRYKGPGFDVRERIRAKFKKEYLVEDPSSFSKMPSADQISAAKPKIVASPSSTSLNFPASLAEANKTFDEAIQSEKFKKDEAAAFKVMNDKIPQASAEFQDKLSQLSQGKNIPDGVKRSGIVDAFNLKGGALKLSNQSIDNTIKQFNKGGTMQERFDIVKNKLTGFGK